MNKGTITRYMRGQGYYSRVFVKTVILVQGVQTGVP